MTKVLPENIQIWVDALRSGEYPQCEGTLYNGEGYCCLGVYAKVTGLVTNEFMIERPYLDLHNNTCVKEGPEEIYSMIREQVGKSVVSVGIEMNDDGETFTSIADMIEDYYNEL